MTTFRHALLPGVSLFALTLLAAPVAAQDFYAGKTITIFAGYAAGTTYDANARFLGRHMERYLPGAPNIIVQNMPGAGTLAAANHVYNIAPKDGTAIAQVARGMALEPMLGGQGVRYDPLKINWLGSTSSEVSVLAVRADTGVKTIEDATKKQVFVATAGKGTDGYTFPTVLNNMLGTKFKLVGGYTGGTEMAMAVERGEVGGRGSWSWSSFKREAMPKLKSGELVLLIQMATEKSPELPNVPLVMDYAKNDEQRQILELLLAGQTMAWPYFVAPEVPADRVDALRKAFIAVTKDPAAKAEAEKLGIELDPVTGEQIGEMLKRLYALPKPVIEQVRELAGRG